VLVIDEAHLLPDQLLEEVRLLSNFETNREKLLQIILCGQPEMAEKLDAPELVQLTQRVRLRFHLSALDQEDIQGYISHRLEVAGAEGRTIFLQHSCGEPAGLLEFLVSGTYERPPRLVIGLSFTLREVLRRQVQPPIEMQGPCPPLRPLTGIRGFHG